MYVKVLRARSSTENVYERVKGYTPPSTENAFESVKGYTPPLPQRMHLKG
jgi:hypothetical protein